MSEKLGKLLLNVESAWLIELYKRNKFLFTLQPLPSHDHTHHLRVWLYARELLNALATGKTKFNETDIIKLLIAVFFHDTGLVKTHKPAHGVESRIICQDYLSQTTAVSDDDKQEILQAVEKHDDKSYTSGSKMADLLSMLSVSDDLDAYGAIGVYRYFEIYKLRGISEALIPSRVTENIAARFAYFEKNFGQLKTFFSKHRVRKNYTLQFFRQFSGGSQEKQQQALNSMKTLNLLMQNAFQNKNGLEFLLKEDHAALADNEFSLRLLDDIRQELIQVKNELNSIPVK